MTTFTELGLAPSLLRALTNKGYTEPTPIQAKAIGPALEGKDLLAAAQTGTGKTAGFALPLLHRLMASANPERPRGRAPRALVLTPTRELAAQVEESVRTYGVGSALVSAVIFGGVGMGNQLTAIKNGIDILIATPGRLLDHLSQRTIDLSRVEILVLDEADRMLDMGFLPSIKRVLAVLPKQNRQTMLFSATFAPEIRELAKQFLRNPVEVQVAPQNSTTALVTHRMHPVSQNQKKDLLVELLSKDSRQQTLIFARTKHGADKLAKQLATVGFRTAAIHGNKSQGARTRALADFKSGAITHLIATDIAARGLDIKELPVVYNFDLPQVAEDYVHRIGRTGRAGSNGVAISLIANEERGQLRDIEKLTKRSFELVPVAGFAVNMQPQSSAPHPAAIARRAQAGKPMQRTQGAPGVARPAAGRGDKPGNRARPNDRRSFAGQGAPRGQSEAKRQSRAG